MSQQLGSKVERQGKANKPTTPRTALKEELPWVGFEPTTLGSLGERSTNLATRATQLVGVRIYNTTQHNTKAHLKPLCYSIVHSHSD